ncbi:hypothetical protein D3C72_2333320 [compost metagenome]
MGDWVTVRVVDSIALADAQVVLSDPDNRRQWVVAWEGETDGTGNFTASFRLLPNIAGRGQLKLEPGHQYTLSVSIDMARMRHYRLFGISNHCTTGDR